VSALSRRSRACRHLLRGFTSFDLALPTGSWTHPWLDSAIPSGFWSKKLTRTLESREQRRWDSVKH
jgi:hypothetical protein